jgi:phage terminase small subunit
MDTGSQLRGYAADGRPPKASPATRLSDLGVSYDQSSKWQKLADVSEEEFEAALAGSERLWGRRTKTEKLLKSADICHMLRLRSQKVAKGLKRYKM